MCPLFREFHDLDDFANIYFSSNLLVQPVETPKLMVLQYNVPLNDSQWCHKELAYCMVFCNHLAAVTVQYIAGMPFTLLPYFHYAVAISNVSPENRMKIIECVTGEIFGRSSLPSGMGGDRQTSDKKHRLMPRLLWAGAE